MMAVRVTSLVVQGRHLLADVVMEFGQQTVLTQLVAMVVQLVMIVTQQCQPLTVMSSTMKPWMTARMVVVQCQRWRFELL